MRPVLLALALVACPKPTPAPVPEPEPAPEPAPPAPEPAADAPVVPQPGPDFAAHFAYADGQVARVEQTIIEQTTVPGMMANRVTITSEAGFEVRAEGDQFAVRWGASEVDVRMEGPEEVVGPLGDALGRALSIAPTVIVDASGAVEDVVLPEDELAAARADIAAMIEAAPDLAREPMRAGTDVLLDPALITQAASEDLAPWNVGEVLLPHQASTPPDERGRRLTFLGWVPCAERGGAQCGALLAQLAPDGAELQRVQEVMTEQFAELPPEQRPEVTDVQIDEQYVFVLEPETGRPHKVAHDKRTSAVLKLEGGAVPYVKNLATAEVWRWEE